MTTNEFTADTLPLEKFPHLTYQTKSVATYEKLVGCLLKRKEYLEMESEEDEYDMNERDIALLQTELELEKLQTTLYQKKVRVGDFRKSCYEVLKEIEEKWNEVLAKARLMMDKNEEIKKAMSDEKKELFEEMIQRLL